MNHLNRLGEVASRCGKVNRALFVTNALRRLSVVLCKGNALVLRAGLHSLAGITGRAVVRARARPIGTAAGLSFCTAQRGNCSIGDVR